MGSLDNHAETLAEIRAPARGLTTGMLRGALAGRAFGWVCALAVVLSFGNGVDEAAAGEIGAVKSTIFPVQAGRPALRWQKAPAGAGAFLASPGGRDSIPVAWKDRTFVGTPMGMLYRRDGGRWLIVRSLYNRRVYPVAVCAGFLWVEVEGQGMAALDWGLHIRKQMPAVKPGCVSVERSGFWCLSFSGRNEYFRPINAGSFNPWSEAQPNNLIHYSGSGKELGHLRTDGKTLPEGGIVWVSVEHDAVWVLVATDLIDKRLPYEGPPQYGYAMVRVDRRSGTRTAVKVSGLERQGIESTPVSVPGRILWAGDIEESDDDTRVYLHSFSKKTLRTTTAGKLAVGNVRYLAADATKLWALGADDKVYVFALATLRPIPLLKAGKAPASLSLAARNSKLPLYNLRAADEARAWVLAQSNQVLEVRDDGRVFAHRLPQFGDSGDDYRTADAAPGSLYLFRRGTLYWVRAGRTDGRTIRLAEDCEPGTVCPELRGVTAQAVWVGEDQVSLTAFHPDLSQRVAADPRAIPKVAVTNSVAFAKSLYFWEVQAGNFYCADGETGKLRLIKSWNKMLRPGQPGDPLGWNEHTVPAHVYSPVALPDGRLLVQTSGTLWATTSKAHGAQGPPAPVWIYDPARDTWTKRAAGSAAKPFRVGGKLYGLRGRQILIWRHNDWQPFAALPFRLWTLSESQDPVTPVEVVLGTRRYLYAQTPMGVYRVKWTELRG